MLTGQLQLSEFHRGQIINGRWEGNSYQILYCIGRGGSASVYLCKDNRGRLKALKISCDLYGLTSEYRVLVFLRCCREMRQRHILPEVFEIDDFQIGTVVYHFIVMEYCHGKNLGSYKGRMKPKDAALVGSQVAWFLNCLHKIDMVFGDLKPSNIMYDFRTGAVMVIDYGSVTVKGHNLKQFTPGYDRASWQAGTRIADEQYDIFALGILLSTLVSGPVSLTPDKKDKNFPEQLTEGMQNQGLKNIVIRALSQGVSDCNELSDALYKIAAEAEVEGASDIGLVINFIGVISVISSFLSLVYYY